jgi:hypothetical protein
LISREAHVPTSTVAATGNGDPGDGRSYRSSYTPGEIPSPSVAIVEAVAAANGVDPLDLDTMLAECVDPDALDALFEREWGRPLELTFSFDEHLVTIRGDGTILVRPAPKSS